jgi:murein DD-endopeptidase MepM/ murein hydrolase activator NlpD
MLKLAAAALFVPALPAVAQESGDITFVFPQDPLVTNFTSSFGDARSGGRAHQGNDLMAPKMTPIYAIAAGLVTIIRDGGRAGRWVAIEHLNGWESWYMHLNNDTPGTDDGQAGWHHTVPVGVVEGGRVAAGELIGWVGDSGNAEPSSPHTHFELHRNGGAIDPYPILREAHQSALADVAAEAIPGLSELVDEMKSSPLRRAKLPF